MSMTPHDYEKAERAHILAKTLSIPFDTAWKISACVTKTAFKSESAAVEKHRNQRAYECPICGRWHTTTRPAPGVPKPARPAPGKPAEADYVAEIVQEFGGFAWTNAAAIGNFLRKRHRPFDVERDLGANKLTQWLDSTGAFEKLRTDKAVLYRPKALNEREKKERDEGSSMHGPYGERFPEHQRHVRGLRREVGHV